MKKNVCGAGKKVLASALSAAMVVAFAPAVAMANGGIASNIEAENAGPAKAQESTITTEIALKQAINNANAGDTVSLGGNITLTSALEINKAITLDGSNCTITGNGIKIEASDVSIKNVVFGDGGFINATVKDGKTTVESCKFTATDSSYVRTAITLAVAEPTVTNCEFAGTARAYYNGIEFGLKQRVSKAVVSGNTFTQTIKNNYISAYNYSDNAQIVIADNTFGYVANGLRISNVGNTHAEFEISNNSYTGTSSDDYAGFILLQDYNGKDAGKQDFSKIKLNISKLSNSSSSKRLFYVYDDQDGIITDNNPLVVGDSTIEGMTTSGDALVTTAEDNGTYYNSLENAIASAKTGDTIKLLADVKDFSGVQINKNLTIDFGNCSVTGAKDAVVFNVSNAKVTLKGDKGGINGGAGGNNVAILANSGSEVTIDSGIYTVGGDANGVGNSTVYVVGTGKAIINGGAFSSEKPYNNKYYVLNLQNSATGSITVNAGIIEKQNPAVGDDNKGGNFVGAGSVSHHVGDSYVVHAADAGTTWVGGSSATCTSSGSTATGYCKGCYDLGIRNVTSAGSAVPAFGHDYSWVTTTPATEDAEGVMTGTCSRGDSTITKAIPKLPKAGSDETVTDSSGAKVDVTVADNKAGKTESGIEYVGSVEYNGVKDGAPAAETKVPETVTVNGSTYVVTKIADEAFEGQEQLTKVTIPETVVEIGERAFAGTSVENVVLPAATTVIGAGIFQGCDDLKSVDISKAAITEIPADAFNGTSIGSIEIPATVTSIGARAFKGTALTSAELPAAVKAIEKSTFENCTALKSVTTSATAVGYKALAGCTALKSIDLSKATELGKYALKGDSKLKTVTTGAKLKAIGYKALSGTKVKVLTISSKKLTAASVKGSLKGSSVKKVEVAVSGSKKTVDKYVAKYKKVFKKSNSGKSVDVVAKKAK